MTKSAVSARVAHVPLDRRLGDGDAEFQPFWALRPRRVYAWTLADFPRRSAAWSFD